MSRLYALVLLLCAAAASGAAPAEADAFLYAVRIGADGRVLTIEAQADARFAAPSAAVDAALREQLLARRYERGDNRGGTLTTWLEGRYDAAADGAPTITALRSGPRPVRIDPPQAPNALVRDKVEADLVLRLKVGTTGVVSIVAIDGLDALGGEHAQRLQERIDYATEVWRFQPERWDGRPIESEVAMQLQYRIDRNDATDWTWRGPAIEQSGPVRVPSEDFRALELQLAAKRR